MSKTKIQKSTTYKQLTYKQIKEVLLDYREINLNCPKSVQKYGERLNMVQELYDGYKNYLKFVARKNSKKIKELTSHYRGATLYVKKNIDRLIGYKDEYIGKIEELNEE